MSHTTRLALSVATLCLAAMSPVAAVADDDAAKDLDAIQGLWEGPRSSVSDRAVVRLTKEIKGETETVTAFDKGGKVYSKHRVPMKLSSQGEVRMWTFFAIEFLEGPRKGFKSPADSSYTFLYRLDGDTLYEVQGLLASDQAKGITPSVYTWKRVKKAK